MALAWATFLCPAVVVIAGLLAPTWPARRGLLFYIAPLVLLGPLWLRLRVRQGGWRRPAIWGVDLLVFLLALLRFGTGHWLPFSGHMLFLTYSTLATRTPWYRAVAVLVALETAWFKFVLWHDPRSFWLGVGGGALAAVAYWSLGGEATDRTSRQQAN